MLWTNPRYLFADVFARIVVFERVKHAAAVPIRVNGVPPIRIFREEAEASKADARRLVRNGLVLRYDTGAGTDGLPEGEAAFLACSFWLADNYALLGRREEARALFERLLALRNDVGLLAEEYDPVQKRQLGNIPQAFSHLALINTAHNLASVPGPAHLRSRRPDHAGREKPHPSGGRKRPEKHGGG